MMRAPLRFVRRPLLLGFALVPLAASAGVGVWTSSGPYGGSATEVAVYEATPSTLFAGGRSGMFRSVNSGSSWQRLQVGLPEVFIAVGLAVATNAPVVYTTNGVRIYRSGNSGNLWVPVAALPSDVFINDLSLQRGSSNDLAVAASDGVYVSSNGGSSWSGPNPASTDVRFENVEYASDGTIYLGLGFSDPAFFGGAFVLRSLDGGATWNPTPSQPASIGYTTFLVSSPAEPSTLIASDGFVMSISTDGGATWSLRNAPDAGGACGRLLSITAHPTNPQAAFVACRSSGVQSTTSLNLANPIWSAWTAANGLTANGIDPLQASAIAVHPNLGVTPTLWVGATDGGMFRSLNNGTNWNPINQNFQAFNVRALATHPVDTGPGSVILAGQGDTSTTNRALMRSPDGGSIWETATSGLNAEQIRSIAIDPTTVDNDPLSTEAFTAYAGGRSDPLPLPANADGSIYKSTDGGNSWATIDNGIALVNGVRNMGTVRTVALDPRSCAAPPPVGPCPIGAGPLLTLFAAGSGVANNANATLPRLSANLYKSTDGGNSWSASENGLPTGQYFGPIGSSERAILGGVNPIVFDPSNTQTIYIGTFLNFFVAPGSPLEPTIANGVFKSVDGGASWVHASNGLPRLFGAASSHHDVLAMAINPANPQTLYAATVNLQSSPVAGRVYKTTDGGANWSEASTGISGQDVRALFIDRADPTGETIYAGTGGNGANPGGVYRSTNGGATWNSISIGLPAFAATALAMPARPVGASPRILAGTNSGVWDYTAAADEDTDGSPSGIENLVLGGDGNSDGIADAQQTGVASLGAPLAAFAAEPELPRGSSLTSTIALVPGTCTQINDASSLQSDLFPPDPAGTVSSHDPWGLVSFSLPGCSSATVRVTFHGATFDGSHVWRNYGPRTPGEDDTFGWYTFAGATRLSATTWELAINANLQGNYRPDSDNVLFVGGPALLPGRIFDNGFD